MIDLSEEKEEGAVKKSALPASTSSSLTKPLVVEICEIGFILTIIPKTDMPKMSNIFLHSNISHQSKKLLETLLDDS